MAIGIIESKKDTMRKANDNPTLIKTRAHERPLRFTTKNHRIISLQYYILHE